MVVVVGTDVADGVVVVVLVLGLIQLDVVAAGRLVVVGGFIPAPRILKAMGVILDVAADVADVVFIVIHVVTSVGFQIGMLAGSGVPMLALIVEPGGIEGVLMGGLLAVIAGGQQDCRGTQAQEQSEYLFHGNTPF